MISFEANNEFNDLLKSLDSLEDKLQTKVVRSGLVALSSPIKKSMKANAPKDQGYLAQSINHKSLNARKKARLGIAETDTAILVGPNKKVNGFSQARKANLVEHGTKAHVIESKNKKIKIGSGFASGKIYHPGIKANPFMLNALQDNESSLQGLFYKGMAKTLDKIRAQ